MVMEDDWDLHAVVRGCATITTTTTTCSSSSSTVTTATNTTSCSVSSSGFGACYQPPAASSYGFPVFGSEHGGQVLTLSDPFEERSSIEELHELYKPFFPKSHSTPSFQASPLSPLSSFSVSSAPKAVQTQQKPGKQSHAGSATTQRSKRRKNQLKKVCQVPAEALSSDIWAWRKYGQKPIKGSPYPRGYYRCSSSKGCLARKQVERNRSDPTMFIVTYTGEHNHPAPTHRNSLAGSTRQKPSTTQVATAGDTEKPLNKPISPASSGVEGEELAAQSAKSESKEEKEDLVDDEEEDEFGISDMVLADDFFEGLDELTRSSPPPPVIGDCFIDPFSAGITLPAWVANSAAAALVVADSF